MSRARYVETDEDAVNRFRFGRYEAYVQDSWRVHSTVTLDFGLRYAFYPPLKDANDKLFTFSPYADDPAKAPTFFDDEGGVLRRGQRRSPEWIPHRRPELAVWTSHLCRGHEENLQPRLGAAWDPGGAGRVVVRAGYGMHFDQTQVGMFTQNVQETFTAVPTRFGMMRS